METHWIPTTDLVYRTIYGKHHAELCVHGSCTEMDDPEFPDSPGRFSDVLPYILTEWGFRNADAPLIKSVRRGEEWTYFIALNKNDPF